MNGHVRREERAERILNYLRKHPDAGDTVEGITRWWLEFERADQYVDDVTGVLDSFLEKGLLRKVQYRDVFLYKINKNKR
ncbi:MAG: hypothetical protein JSV84_12980 [Gemmatimonadota bacterium]|nr:MAG: hypothetical protein JSV84_12980 [Gemmatimonadota bacterium]